MLELARAAFLGGLAGTYFLIQAYFVFEVNDAVAGDRGELHAPDRTEVQS